MPEKEDQVRWEDTKMFALYKLQGRVYLHPRGKEAQSSQRVCLPAPDIGFQLIRIRAKYIEGLENRLGRMESLLKLSGLLNEEDDDKDLGTLEKNLAPQSDKHPTPNSSTTSPEPPKEPEEEVEALSDMMCSLVTNNCGESRYIGRL